MSYFPATSIRAARVRPSLPAALACIVLAACSERHTAVTIPFEARLGDSTIACDGASGPTMTDLRFYVYDITLRDAAGERRDVRLDPDGLWQQEALALLDLEDGSGTCVNGTTATHTALTGTVLAGDYRGFEFTLGVPFALNHGDPLAAEAPLGDPDMHWHWRGGYKFLRAGVRQDDDGFWMHLGSTGCKGTIGNITGCDAPNRVHVQLAGFVPGDTVVIDLAELLAPGELDDGIATDCSSGPAEPHCGPAFLALGLDHPSGVASGEQRLFSRRQQ